MSKSSSARRPPRTTDADMRTGYILRRLREEPVLSVGSLAEELRVSEMTVHRALDEIEKMVELNRPYGGVSLRRKAGHGYYWVKSQRCPIEKALVANACVDLFVNDGDHLLLDGGTQCEAVVEALQRHDKRGIRVVSHAANFSMHFLSYPDAEFVCLGGCLNKRASVFLDSIEGFSTDDFFERHAREFFQEHCLGTYRAIITGTAFSPTAGLTVNTQAVIKFKQLVINRASELLILLDHSKFLASACATVTYCGLKVDGDWLIPRTDEDGIQNKPAKIIVDTRWGPSGEPEVFRRFVQKLKDKAVKGKEITLTPAQRKRHPDIRIFETSLKAPRQTPAGAAHEK